MNEITIKVELVTGTSKKTDNEYTFLKFKFPNGYEMDVFPNKDQKFAVLQNFTK